MTKEEFKQIMLIFKNEDFECLFCEQCCHTQERIKQAIRKKLESLLNKDIEVT